MSKSVFVQQLESGTQVDSEFAITSSNVFQAKNGTNRLALRLADRTGKVDAVWWDCADDAHLTFPNDSVVNVQGRVGTYRESLQITVEAMTVVDPSRVDQADFVPCCPRDPAEMEQALRALVETIEHEELRKVCETFMADPLFELYCRVPGGKRWHHGYLHGLLEHVLSIMQACDKLCEHYTFLNRDLILTAALLHDLGKTRELRVGMSMDYTSPGRLLGHQVMTIPMVSRYVQHLSPRLKMELLHTIAAHHGEEEGSLVKPMTREAALLHFVDNMDATLNAWSREIDRARDDGREWTDYVNLIGRFLYAGGPEDALSPEDSSSPAGETDDDHDAS